MGASWEHHRSALPPVAPCGPCHFHGASKDAMGGTRVTIGARPTLHPWPWVLVGLSGTGARMLWEPAVSLDACLGSAWEALGRSPGPSMGGLWPVRLPGEDCLEACWDAKGRLGDPGKPGTLSYLYHRSSGFATTAAMLFLDSAEIVAAAGRLDMTRD